ncbi:MAG: SDR family NAD(P)-dependent oxidoreductase [Sedimenticola sp.]
MPVNNILIVFGISSYIGYHLVQRVLAQGSYHQIIGIYRTDNEYTKYLSELEGEPVRLIQNDIMYSNVAVEDYLSEQEKKTVRHISVLYACGMWLSGPLSVEDRQNVDRVNAIGFVVPAKIVIDLLSWAARSKNSIQFIALTGLAGEKGAVKYNAIYNATVTALCNFCRAAATEVAGTQSIVMAYSLGLFDKGQSYIHDLCKNLVIKKPLAIEKTIEPIAQQLHDRNYCFNGAVVELADGLFNYQDACHYLHQPSNSP